METIKTEYITLPSSSYELGTYFVLAHDAFLRDQAPPAPSELNAGSSGITDNQFLSGTLAHNYSALKQCYAQVEGLQNYILMYNKAIEDAK